MQQYRKGRRLVSLCQQKIQDAQRNLARDNLEKKQIIEQMKQLEAQLRDFADAIIAQQIANGAVTRAEIYDQRKQLAILLHQRQQAQHEHNLLTDDLSQIEFSISQHQKLLSQLTRKEKKLTQWTQFVKNQWAMRNDSAVDEETQDCVVLQLQSSI